MRIVFDFDGTIADTSPGILASLKEAFAELEMPVPEPLNRFIGPPLTDAMMEFCGVDREKAEEIIRVYRKYYSARGMYDAYLYPGIRELLDSLRKEGHDLYIATSKPEVYARKMLEAMETDGYFAEICGAEMDTKRNHKTEVLEELFSRIGASPLDPNSTNLWCMVGDRMYDAEGAAAFRMPCIGVLWGFGSPEEFRHAPTAQTPEDLHSVLGWISLLTV